MVRRTDRLENVMRSRRRIPLSYGVPERLAIPQVEQPTPGIKLTRGETIDLMVEEALKAVRARIKEVEKERNEHKLTLEQLTDFQLLGRPNSERVYIHHDGSAVEITVRLEPDEFPTWLREFIERRDAIAAEYSTLHTTLTRLMDRTGARVTILTQLLQRTAEGRNFLEGVRHMSVALSGLPRRLP